MDKKAIGLAVTGQNVTEVLDGIEQAEKIGIQAAWLLSGGVTMDPLTILSAAARRTERIKLGTSIVTFWPRHPLAMVQQVLVLSQLASGRFRLGIGPSGKTGIENTYGIPFQAPLGHMREYLRITRGILQKGAVDFDGQYYKAHAKIAAPADVPVMISALQRRSFELSGAEADGAITWICPGFYLKDVALPAMKAAAEKSGRPVPSLIVHAAVCAHGNIDEVHGAVREQMGFYPRAPHYAQMFTDAGFPEAKEGAWSDRMIDSVVFSGSDSRITERLNGLFSIGASELVLSLVTAGADKNRSREHSMQLISKVARSIKG